MSAADRQTLALIMTNAGGEGKSTWAETLAAFGRLAGLDVVVADVDAGNRGYLNRNGDGSALSLDWSPKADGDAGAPADPAAWFDRHLAGCKLAILDTGANMLAAANPISSFIGGLIQVAKARGTRIIVYGVTSPHKPGSDELVEAMYQRFHRAAEVVVVQNDRDGSNVFAASLGLIGTPIVSLPYLDPGLLALRLRRRIPLDEILARPDPGYERATALIAQRLLAAAKQDAVIDVVGNAAATALEAFTAACPSNWSYRIMRLDQTTDAAITANERLAKAWTRFRLANRNEEANLLAAAIELRDANDGYAEYH